LKYNLTFREFNYEKISSHDALFLDYYNQPLTKKYWNPNTLHVHKTKKSTFGTIFSQRRLYI